MKLKFSLYISVLFLSFWQPQAFAADSAQLGVSTVKLVADVAAIQPGKAFHIGLLLTPKPGWHSYWQNPGDAGMPTSLNLTLPDGFSAGDIDWPVPERLAEGPLVTYAYTSTTLLPVTVTPPAALDNGSYHVAAKADWLVCKDVCIPQSAALDMDLPVAAEGQAAQPSEAAPLFEEHERHRPTLLAEPVAYQLHGEQLILSAPLSAIGMQAVNSASFFPRQENVIQYAAEQKLSTSDGRLYLTLAGTGAPPKTPLSGLLSVSAANGATQVFDVTLAASPMAMAMHDGQPELWLPWLLALAVTGGLILNLMPCVLPVLSLKALAIARKSGRERRHTVRQGVAYSTGILASFAVIAVTLLLLRQGGEAIGWGFQMQSPVFIGLLIYILFLVGLSLSGLFYVPVLFGNGTADDTSLRGAFFTGVLATLVATPCTAPFMATAVGAALTLPGWQALLVFEALGFGLALPFLLLSLFPRLLRFLPRPGAWMEGFKQFLAFPMYGSVIWLLWVLTLQTGAGGMVVALTVLLLMVFFIWYKQLADRTGAHFRTFWLYQGIIIAISLMMLNQMESGSIEQASGMQADSIPFSSEKLAALRQAGTPVFVDATAAWCITCQLNGRVTLNTARVQQAFKDQGVTPMVADWTRQNADITTFLGGFGYKGVPLYVFYPASHGAPVVLPQLLTTDIIIATLHHP